MDTNAVDRADLADPADVSGLPLPPPPPAHASGPINPWAGPPLQPGQLSPGWRMVFIAGWIGVLAGFGALWQAGRIAGIAPWWLGPETNLRAFPVIALPFIAPLIVVVLGVLGIRICCYVGIVAGLISAAVALGDRHFPGLAVVDVAIGACGVLVSLACLGGRMRAAPEITASEILDAEVPAAQI